MAKETKTNAMRILERAKVSYEMLAYECEDFVDGKDVADKLGQDYEMTFKTLVTKGKSNQYHVFVIPVHRELDLKKAAKAAGEKNLEMIPVKDINQVTGYIRGGCTPVGMKKDFPTVIHESCVEQDKIAISGGRRGLQIVLSPVDLLQVTRGKTADVIRED